MRLTAKQVPHRPGISAALNLRAEGDGIFIVMQITLLALARELSGSGDLVTPHHFIDKTYTEQPVSALREVLEARGITLLPPHG